MKPEDSVIQHVAHVQNLASQLKVAGQEINENDIMAKVLGSLPPKYSMLATAWDSVQIEDQRIGVLLERLIKEESRLSIEGETSAFSAVSHRKKCASRDNKCKKDNSKSERHDKSQEECYYCKKKGHFARECYKKKRDKQHESGKDNENNAFVATVPDKQYNEWMGYPSSGEMLELKSMKSEDTWITDSGASRHMTYRREWLIDFKPVVGEVVSLGNGGQCKRLWAVEQCS